MQPDNHQWTIHGNLQILQLTREALVNCVMTSAGNQIRKWGSCGVVGCQRCIKLTGLVKKKMTCKACFKERIIFQSVASRWINRSSSSAGLFTRDETGYASISPGR